MLNTRYSLLVFIGLIFLIGMSSCISNKKIVYLEDKSADSPHDYLADVTYNAQNVPFSLQENDVISIKINHLQLTRPIDDIQDNNESIRSNQIHPFLNGFTLDFEGNVDLPIIGKINLKGMNLSEAQQAISNKAKLYFPSPSVRVFIMNYYVTVLGEVNAPGRYPVYNNSISVFEAIGLAGDATDFANREEVKILRLRDGKNHLFHVDLTDERLLDSELAFLQPNDVIMIKPQKRKKYSTRDVQNIYNGIGTIFSAVTLYLLITR